MIVYQLDIAPGEDDAEGADYSHFTASLAAAKKQRAKEIRQREANAAKELEAASAYYGHDVDPRNYRPQHGDLAIIRHTVIGGSRKRTVIAALNGVWSAKQEIVVESWEGWAL